MGAASTRNREQAILLLLLLAASGLLAVGLVTPLLTTKTLIFMRNSFSILSGIYDLWASEKYILFFTVSLFSLVLPIVKIAFLTIYLLDWTRHRPASNRLLTLIHDYGRWAMLDVLVVAILIVTVKLGAVASVEVHPGLYIFGGAVLLIMLVTDRVAKTRAH